MSRITQNWWLSSYKVGLVSWLAISGAIASSFDWAIAQSNIVPDNTLGANHSAITPNVNINGLPSERISGGAIRGANLFHSFREFNIDGGRGAYFVNPNGIENIFSRVTGANPSSILGRLGVLGNANLFLINPQGIIFGKNASLDIKGSFVASTASSLNFADGTEFSATAPQTTPLLTISTPFGLQFGPNPGTIANQSANLQVQPGRTLALVGGDVVLEGGTLKASSGRIELGSAGGNSLVSLTPTLTGYALAYEGIQDFQDISLKQGAFVTSSGNSGGAIQVQGANITLTDGSRIEANLKGSGTSEGLTVNASQGVQVIGISANGIRSGLLAQATEKPTGVSGALTITTPVLQVLEGAEISTLNSGSGKGGTLTINASQGVQVMGESADGKGSQVIASTSGTGDAGDLTINTSALQVWDGALVSASTFSAEEGAGDAGKLTVNASESVQLRGTSNFSQFRRSGLFADSLGKGEAGEVTINTSALQIWDGARVSVSSLSQGSLGGNGGRLTVNASESVKLMGIGKIPNAPSGLFASTSGIGNGGEVTINTAALQVWDGALVSVRTFSSLSNAGDAGNLTVNASQLVQVSGTAADGISRSQLIASTDGVGDAGDLTITTPVLEVLDGGRVSATTFNAEMGDAGAAGDLRIFSQQLVIENGAKISARSFGAGNAGTLEVNATESVRIDGKDSGLYFDTSGSGDALGIRIQTGQLVVENEGEVTVSGTGSGNPGNLEAIAHSIFLSNQGRFTAITASGEGGNIQLQVHDSLLMRHNSEISASAEGLGNGGNITIEAPNGLIVAVLSENSDIVASANQGNGGKVRATAVGVLGFRQFRDRRTLESDFTASSELGIDGTLEINTQDRELEVLPENFADVEIAQGCQAVRGKEQSQFIIAGRGGLPPNPREALSSDAVFVDWVALNPERETPDYPPLPTQGEIPTVTQNFTYPTPVPIVEATGWVINAKGEVILVADAPIISPHSPWHSPTDCALPQSAISKRAELNEQYQEEGRRLQGRRN